ncbi:hypothetical protein M9458_054850 [Cirrhinus mrigala]|uniref:Reverse transcriptase domain-containing protein n=1 Tax=Cirrhinus mrigala TaxID=683832 RepID=A0ABD0MM07_CIRMR
MSFTAHKSYNSGVIIWLRCCGTQLLAISTAKPEITPSLSKELGITRRPRYIHRSGRHYLSSRSLTSSSIRSIWSNCSDIRYSMLPANHCVYSSIHSNDFPTDFAPGTLTDFDPPTPAYISELLSKTNPCFFHLDPAPTSLLKYSAPVISRPISLLISKILSTGVVPLELKTAAVIPVYECFQSGFRSYHSPETALLKVVNDLLMTTAGSVSILFILDLSSAFDTLSHSILISRLSALGISGTALAWFTSYLSDRQHYITIRKAKSSTAPVSHGVPQGSVLGPLLFIIYMFPLGKIIRRHGFNFHCYADDTQLYISFRHNHPFPINSISACIDDINAWMTSNFLKLNTDKTDVLLVGSPKNVAPFCTDTVNISGILVRPSTTVKNLDTTFDSYLSFLPHISSLTKYAFYHLRNIARLRPFLNIKDAETLVHTFITSRLDYCNSLFYDLPNTTLNKLQYIQNSAARVLTYSKKSSHITPILHRLHWLPVRFRIQYKILLITFKILHYLHYLRIIIYQLARP